MMRRMVFDLGEVRLQAPEGWIRLESRGERIVLRDPGFPTPIFVELLYRIERVERWIAALATGGKRITGFQEPPDCSARRFVLEASGGRSPLQRAYRMHRVEIAGSACSWVVASVDLDGDRQRSRILGTLFSRAIETAIRDAVHVLQYLEDDQRGPNGQVGPGFTLALPRSHEIHDVDGNRYLIHDGRALIGWMTVDPRSQVAIEFASEQGADRGKEFLRVVRAGLRIWDTEFRGHWRPPVHIEWRDAKLPAAPAASRPTPTRPSTPRPPAASLAPSAPPGQQLQAEWDARLKGAYLGYESAGSSGYDPRFASGGYRKEFIALRSDHEVSWEEVVHTSASYANIYVGGPTRTQRSGIWRVELENDVPRLVLYCGREGGVHHFELGAVSASYVTCKGRRYTLVK